MVSFNLPIFHQTFLGQALKMIYLHYFTVGGHDSKEDAVAALDLMKYKVKEDLKRL